MVLNLNACFISDNNESASAASTEDIDKAPMPPESALFIFSSTNMWVVKRMRVRQQSALLRMTIKWRRKLFHLANRNKGNSTMSQSELEKQATVVKRGKHKTCTRRWNCCQARETWNWNATRRKSWVSIGFCFVSNTWKECHESSQIKPSQANTKLKIGNGSVPLFDNSGNIICKKFRTLKFRAFYFETLFISFRTKISDTLQKHSLSRCTPTRNTEATSVKVIVLLQPRGYKGCLPFSGKKLVSRLMK